VRKSADHLLDLGRMAVLVHTSTQRRERLVQGRAGSVDAVLLFQQLKDLTLRVIGCPVAHALGYP